MRISRSIIAVAFATLILSATGATSHAELIDSRATTYEQRQDAVSMCPEVDDFYTSAETPSMSAMGFTFTATGQEFRLINRTTFDFVTRAENIVGCYIDEVGLADGQLEPLRIVGTINRTAVMNYYFINGMGERWKLTISADHKSFTTQPGSKFYSLGNQLILKRPIFSNPTISSIIQCKKGKIVISVKGSKGVCPKGYVKVIPSPTPTPKATSKPRPSASSTKSATSPTVTLSPNVK